MGYGGGGGGGRGGHLKDLKPVYLPAGTVCFRMPGLYSQLCIKLTYTESGHLCTDSTYAGS